ncbi:MAG TPA: TadE/TadG family type IV pilus assembly protein [Vicinamibacterales bacterium]|nr:TadE/TadG family type IV pilus assembly protein [Vicinamibacterales bacterium]
MTRYFSRRVVRRIRDPRGATLVEAAIITPLLLLLTFSIVDFASLFYVYLALENGVSQATRYAVTGSVVSGMTREESIMAAMRSATPTLTIDDAMFTFSHLPPGSPPGTAWSAGSGIENDVGRVTIDYPWTLMTPLIRPFFTGGQINVRVESAMKNERRFD